MRPVGVASGGAVAGLGRAAGWRRAVVAARGPRAKPVTQGGAIGSVALDFFLLKYR